MTDYKYTILPGTVDDPVTVDLTMMEEKWNSTLFQKLFPFKFTLVSFCFMKLLEVNT